MSTLHVSCAAEGAAYVGHTATMLHSLLSHADGHHVRVHYLHSPRLAPRDRQLLAEMVEGLGGSIRFLVIDDREVSGLPATRQFTVAMWYRIFLPELVAEADRIL